MGERRESERKLAFEEFLKNEELATEKTIKETFRLADFCIINEASQEKLSEEIDKVINRMIQ